MSSARTRFARYRRRLALALLLLGLLLVGSAGYMWFQYLNTREVVELPLATRVLGLDQPIYSFSIYGVDLPLGVAVSPDGQRIYVTEGGGERLIKVFDAKGNSLNSFSTPGTTKSTRKPLYVAVSPDGLVYVSDARREGIEVHSPEGELHTTLVPTLGTGETWAPAALAFDKEGNLYVTDVGQQQQRVLIFGRRGDVIGQINGAFTYPNGIAVDDNGVIYVADSNNGRIVAYDRNGQLLSAVKDGQVGQPMGMPRGLALDKDGRLLALDTFDHSIQVFRFPPFKFQFKMGKYGFGDGEFAYPNGMAIDKLGHIYIADRENNRIQVWF